MQYETTSDAVLIYLREYLLESTLLPASIKDIRLRDSSKNLTDIHIVLAGDEPDEHDTLYGMEKMSGYAELSLSADDVAEEDDRRWMLSQIEAVLRTGFTNADTGENICFPEWLTERNAGVRCFEFRVQGSHWESDDRRINGKVMWTSWAILQG